MTFSPCSQANFERKKSMRIKRKDSNAFDSNGAHSIWWNNIIADKNSFEDYRIWRVDSVTTTKMSKHFQIFYCSLLILLIWSCSKCDKLIFPFILCEIKATFAKSCELFFILMRSFFTRLFAFAFDLLWIFFSCNDLIWNSFYDNKFIQLERFVIWTMEHCCDKAHIGIIFYYRRKSSKRIRDSSERNTSAYSILIQR